MLQELLRRLIRRCTRIAKIGGKLIYGWSRDHCTVTFRENLEKTIRPICFSDVRAEGFLNVLSALTQEYRAHRFDLLGSGWCLADIYVSERVDGWSGFDQTGDQLHKIINKVNYSRSAKIFGLIDMPYSLVDWQCDIRSGARWQANTWYRQIKFGKEAGVDVKMPWEMARMHHLPQLALVDLFITYDGEGLSKNAKEFRNQILDFIATNPPRFGVNWVTSMDVGIRASNWVMAYSLFRASGAQFDLAFDSEFTSSLYSHGEHIINNLEWDPVWRGNHYLADIVGLLFVAAVLPRSLMVDAWLAFAVQELILEVERQFYPDGANFEASTSYHRLSGEMVIYSTALVLGLSDNKKAALVEYDHGVIRTPRSLQKPPLSLHPIPGMDKTSPFPEWYFQRLHAVAEFTIAVTKPNGQIVQIGDNDSGRFLKIQPSIFSLKPSELASRYASLSDYEPPSDMQIYWQENILDHRHLVSAINGLFRRNDFTEFAGEFELDMQVVRQLSGNCHVVLPDKKLNEINDADNLVETNKIEVPELAQTLIIDLPDEDVITGLRCEAFTDFGLYLFRSERLFLSVRCGPIGQDGFGGHAHNDQLAVELNIDGKDLIADPGTYVYTPYPDERQRYRSVYAHFAPQVEGFEPGNMELGLWRLGDEAQARCHYFGERRFFGSHKGYGPKVFRLVEIEAEQIIIRDWTEGELRLRDIMEQYRALNAHGSLVPFCPGYGIQYA